MLTGRSATIPLAILTLLRPIWVLSLLLGSKQPKRNLAPHAWKLRQHLGCHLFILVPLQLFNLLQHYIDKLDPLDYTKSCDVSLGQMAAQQVSVSTPHQYIPLQAGGSTPGLPGYLHPGTRVDGLHAHGGSEPEDQSNVTANSGATNSIRWSICVQCGAVFPFWR